jgi:outer membrane protein OmpA-like peptidoglycan-associated protein
MGAGFGVSSLTPEVSSESFLLTEEETASGFKLFIGYQLLENANIDLVYADLGEATFSHRLQPGQEIGGLSYGVLAATGSYYFYRPMDKLGLYAKAGLATISNESSSSSVPYEQESNMQISYGLGAEWQLTKGISVRADYDQYASDASLVSFSLLSKFVVRSKRLAKLFKASDRDKDGVPDDQDLCPDTPRFSVLNISGCPDQEVERQTPVETQTAVAEQSPLRQQKQPVNSAFRAAENEIAGLDLSSIDFKKNSAELTEVAMILLDLLADIMLEYEAIKVQVKVHTNDIGEAEENLHLSVKRANVIKAYLAEQGVKRTRIAAEGYGETKPISSNKTSKGRALNRRVEVRIR